MFVNKDLIRWLILFIFSFFLLSVLFFCHVPKGEAAYTKSAQKILERMQKSMEEASQGSGSGKFDAKDVYDKLLKTFDATVSNCGMQMLNEGKIFISRFLDYFDFIESFKDIFYRNECQRTDIWDIEEQLNKLSDAMDLMALSCSPESIEKRKILTDQYTATQIQLKFLRKFGIDPEASGKIEEEFKKYGEQSENPRIRDIVLHSGITYFNNEYLDYNEKTNPNGCQDTFFSSMFKPVIDRWKRVREKAALMWSQDIGGFFDFSEGEKERKARAQAKAKQWFSNFNFGVFRVGSVNELADESLMGGKPSIYERIKGLWGGFVNLGHSLYSNSVPPPKNLEDIIAERQVIILHHEMTAELRRGENVYARDLELNTLKASYDLLFNNSSMQAAQDLENKIIMADQCARAAYMEESSIIAACGAGGEKSLPTFEKALDYMLKHHCISGVGGSRCIIPPKWINKVKP